MDRSSIAMVLSMTKGPDPTTTHEIYLYKGQALKAVTEKLRTKEDAISDSVVGAIATLTEFEVRLLMFIADIVYAYMLEG
jgi:hypothetical protein